MDKKLTKTVEIIRLSDPVLYDDVYAGAVGTADLIETMGGSRAEYAQGLIDGGRKALAEQRAVRGPGYWDSTPELTRRDDILAFASIAAGYHLLAA